MIRFTLKPEPPAFNARVREPGRRWLAENPKVERAPGQPASKRLPSHWLEVKDEVAEAFGHLCAYTAMWLSHPGEIDHFVSVDEDRDKAYEWSNYRYCAGWFNRSKKNRRSSEILDPFEIEDDWFEILLPSLQLVVTDRCPEGMRTRAEVMLTQLHLRNGSQVIRIRRQFLEQYNKYKDLQWLDEYAPLLARAIRKKETEEQQLGST